MLARLWIGCVLSMVVTLGCAKSEPVATTPTAETQPAASPAQSEAESRELTEAAAPNNDLPRLDAEEALAESSEATDDELSPAVEAKLLARLAKQPRDAEALLKLASIKQQQAEMTDSGELDYGKLKQSADYARRALQADATLTESDQVRSFVAVVFFNEACALARDKQDAQALKSIRAASDYGFSDLAEMQNAVDLGQLRKNPEFQQIVKLARDKRKQEMQATISALFIGKPDYQFDFALEDTAGAPVAKRDFAGKLLIVNIWGTWCPPCRRELPDLIAASKKYQSQGVEVLGLNTESENGVTAVNTIKDSQKTFGITYRCALGNDELFKQIPDFNAVPMTLFFNRQGELQAQWVGQIDEMALEMIIERLIAESPAPAGQTKP